MRADTDGLDPYLGDSHPDSKPRLTPVAISLILLRQSTITAIVYQSMRLSLIHIFNLSSTLPLVGATIT